MVVVGVIVFRKRRILSIDNILLLFFFFLLEFSCLFAAGILYRGISISNNLSSYRHIPIAEEEKE